MKNVLICILLCALWVRIKLGLVSLHPPCGRIRGIRVFIRRREGKTNSELCPQQIKKEATLLGPVLGIPRALVFWVTRGYPKHSQWHSLWHFNFRFVRHHRLTRSQSTNLLQNLNKISLGLEKSGFYPFFHICHLSELICPYAKLKIQGRKNFALNVLIILFLKTEWSCDCETVRRKPLPFCARRLLTASNPQFSVYIYSF